MTLPSAFDRFRDDIETEIRSLVLEEDFPLYRMMGYHMGWLDEYGEAAEGYSGKRIRPTLCLLACEALGGDVTAALPAAAAVELVHNFSLIHDDIQDGNSERHNRPTVWWVWGPAPGHQRRRRDARPCAPVPAATDGQGYVAGAHAESRWPP